MGTYATNVMGTVNLLEAVRQAGAVGAMVVVTSDKCYENREWHWGYREDEALGGHDPYSNSKGCAELVTSAYRASFFAGQDGASCRVATARAGNVIGGGDWSKDRLIPDLIRSFARGESTEIRSPHAIRPWQHVLEPLSGYVRLAERLLGADGQACAEAWNFGPADEDCRPSPTWSIASRRAGIRTPPGTCRRVPILTRRISSRWMRPRRGRGSAGSVACRSPWPSTGRSKWYRRQRDGDDARRLTLEQIERYEELQGA